MLAFAGGLLFSGLFEDFSINFIAQSEIIISKFPSRRG
jgi:hypothetical protein